MTQGAPPMSAVTRSPSGPPPTLVPNDYGRRSAKTYLTATLVLTAVLGLLALVDVVRTRSIVLAIVALVVVLLVPVVATMLAWVLNPIAQGVGVNADGLFVRTWGPLWSPVKYVPWTRVTEVRQCLPPMRAGYSVTIRASRAHRLPTEIRLTPEAYASLSAWLPGLVD